MKISAVAFDIDGTLYPGSKLYSKIFVHFFQHIMFYFHFGVVRKKIRQMAVQEDLYKTQAEMLAARVKMSVEATEKKIAEVCYEGIAKYFKAIKPFNYIEETFAKFKSAGLKIGILSDFPVGQKGEVWGCLKYCDVALSAEETGALKPNLRPFEVLAQKLGVAAEEVLYVGNHQKYDAGGSRNAGMKAALIVPKWQKKSVSRKKIADIVFSDYRELQQAVLEK